MGRALDRPQDRDRDDRQRDHREHPTHDRLVVALAGVAPAPLVHARKHQHGQAAAQHPPDRAVAQVRVVAGRPVVETQLKGEVVRECKQRPIHREAYERVAVQGRSRRTDPSAHFRGL